jgi:hypothetical protein
MGHFASLLAAQTHLGAGLLFAGVVGKVVRCWIAHRTATHHEAESTRRIELAVNDTESAERAAIVDACAQLEAASRCAPDHCIDSGHQRAQESHRSQFRCG